MNSTIPQSQSPISIAIIGGGLGGLTLAHLLQQHSNFQITVFERDDNQLSRGQGYYIGLNPEPIEILKTFIPHIPSLSLILGEVGCPSRFFLADEFLRELLAFGGGENAAKLVNRWGLRECLTQNLKKDIIWGKKFKRYEEMEDGVIVYFEDGTEEKFDFVVGADGALSSVRKQRCPGITMKFTGYVNCSGTMDFPENSEEMKEIEKFIVRGFLRIMGKNGHTYLVFRYQNQKTKKPEVLWSLSWPAQSEDLDDYWHMSKKSDHLVLRSIENSEIAKKLHVRLIQKTIQNFKHQQIISLIQNSLTEKLKGIRKVNSSVPCTINPLGKTTRVTLLGDAMHPMTTHRGLGANTAILDAKDLALALIKAGEGLHQGVMWKDCIGEYETILFKRGTKAVKESLGGSGMIHLKGWKGWLRNWVLWIIGRVVNSYVWGSSWFSWKKK